MHLAPPVEAGSGTQRGAIWNPIDPGICHAGSQQAPSDTVSRRSMATSGQKSSGSRQSSVKRGNSQQRRRQHQDEAGIIPVLARAVRAHRELRRARQGQPANRTRFRVVAVLVREERARIKGDTTSPTPSGPKSSPASTASPRSWPRRPRATPALIQLAHRQRPAHARRAGDAPGDADRGRRANSRPRTSSSSPRHRAKPAVEERQVVPQSVKQFQMSNPFLAPDFSDGSAGRVRHGRPACQLGAHRAAVPLVRGRCGGGAASMDSARRPARSPPRVASS